MGHDASAARRDGPDGDISFNATGLDQMLDSNCRLLAGGQQPCWIPFAVALTPEGAYAAASALGAAIRARQARQAKEKSESSPSREQAEQVYDEIGEADESVVAVAAGDKP